MKEFIMTFLMLASSFLIGAFGNQILLINDNWIRTPAERLIVIKANCEEQLKRLQTNNGPAQSAK